MTQPNEKICEIDRSPFEPTDYDEIPVFGLILRNKSNENIHEIDQNPYEPIDDDEVPVLGPILGNESNEIEKPQEIDLRKAGPFEIGINCPNENRIIINHPYPNLFRSNCSGSSPGSDSSNSSESSSSSSSSSSSNSTNSENDQKDYVKF